MEAYDWTIFSHHLFACHLTCDWGIILTACILFAATIKMNHFINGSRQLNVYDIISLVNSLFAFFRGLNC